MAGDPSQPPLTGPAFAARLDVSRETIARLEAYLSILATWQQKINLVGPRTMADPWRRHLLDSAQLASHLPAGAGALLDLGSGAGFPGLAIAILTGRPVILVESNGRKCAFLREVARQTAAPVEIRNRRIESLKLPTPAMAVMARACAPLAKLLEYSLELRAKDGVCLFLKGRDVQRELTDSANEWMISYSLHESLSDSTGAILKIGAFSKRHGN